MLWLLACSTPEYPLEVELNPESIEFPWVAWDEEPPESVHVGLRNRGEGPAWVTLGEFEGEGAGNLSVVGEVADKLLMPGRGVDIRVGLSRNTQEWTDGEFELELPVDAVSAVGGGAGSGLRHGDTTETFVLPVLVRIDCDLDDDGEESTVCGGEDWEGD
jgi:hypothetical protein